MQRSVYREKTIGNKKSAQLKKLKFDLVSKIIQAKFFFPFSKNIILTNNLELKCQFGQINCFSIIN